MFHLTELQIFKAATVANLFISLLSKYPLLSYMYVSNSLKYSSNDTILWSFKILLILLWIYFRLPYLYSSWNAVYPEYSSWENLSHFIWIRTKEQKLLLRDRLSPFLVLNTGLSLTLPMIKLVLLHGGVYVGGQLYHAALCLVLAKIFKLIFTHSLLSHIPSIFYL